MDFDVLLEKAIQISHFLFKEKRGGMFSDGLAISFPEGNSHRVFSTENKQHLQPLLEELVKTYGI